MERKDAIQNAYCLEGSNNTSAEVSMQRGTKSDFSFVASEKKCNAWHDYEMSVAPYDMNKPIYYEFIACPIAEFAKQHDLLEVMPDMCNPDCAAMELLHARLVRTTTCANDCKCDYTICGDRDEYMKEHPEYVDKVGFRRNT